MKVGNDYSGLNTEDHYTIPSNSIEDIDIGVYKLFDIKLCPEVTNGDETIGVPVVFATGERFALTRRSRPIRDKNGALILPLISIIRTNLNLAPNLGGFGTAIAHREQDLYIIKRKLSKEDRAYQNLINKKGLKNQENVSKRKYESSATYPGAFQRGESQATRRNGGNLAYYRRDITLEPDIGKNIYEIITIPYPEFILTEYEVTIWTQYMEEGNEIVEHLISMFEGQDRAYTFNTSGGYEHVAFVSNTIGFENNFKDHSNDERIIKHNFTVSVPGYIIAPNSKGRSTPFRRFLSAPEINFEISEAKSRSVIKSSPNLKDKTNKFILSDVEQLDESGETIDGREDTGIELLYEDIDAKTGKKTQEYRKVISRNRRKGETVLSADYFIKLEDSNE